MKAEEQEAAVEANKHMAAKKQKPKKKMPVTPFYRGGGYDSQGSGKFVKDIVRVGEWVHPATGQLVEFTAERLQRLASNTTKYIEAGNKIPFPSGHSFKVEDNLGFWPGPFMIHEDALVAVVEPKDQTALDKIKDGTLDAVSVYIEFDHTDVKGNKYDEVITHVAATNYPVLTEQEEFVELALSIKAEPLIPADEWPPEDGNEEPPGQVDSEKLAKAFEQLSRQTSPASLVAAFEALAR